MKSYINKINTILVVLAYGYFNLLKTPLLGNIQIK